uniref:GRF-type domain-containing protein n=1 Tax=Ixodes ricinus TaxID=34613 RepID=V5IE45_IXORI
MHHSTNTVELLKDDATEVPFCKHGPALLFRRIGTAGKNSGRPFYACSGCRKRKDCVLFVWKDDLLSRPLPDSKTWDHVRNEVVPASTHDQLYQKLRSVSKRPPSERFFCCRKLLARTELGAHRGHAVTTPVEDDDLRRPSRLINADVTNTTKAQYFFSDACVTFVCSLLEQQHFESVICVGTPSIHEHLRESRPQLPSILLDIEQTYEQFYGPSEFAWFNMFNGFFFRGSSAEETVQRHLSSGTRCALLIDPPFGGLVDAIARTLAKMVSYAAAVGSTLSILWFFPYFNEKRIVEAMPSLRMLDFAVDYRNHVTFNESGRTKGSPVRIFTDIPPGQVKLPSDRYRYCYDCDRWVALSNTHCDICKDCTSKDGGPYRHCDECGVCVKLSHVHCPRCQSCLPQGHSCGSTGGVVCFLCKMPGHKSVQCSANRKGQKNAGKRKRTE